MIITATTAMHSLNKSIMRKSAHNQKIGNIVIFYNASSMQVVIHLAKSLGLERNFTNSTTFKFATLYPSFFK